MIKAKFNSHVRIRTETALKNEVLAKVLCHNTCCLIQAEFELGIINKFWKPDGLPSLPPDMVDST